MAEYQLSRKIIEIAPDRFLVNVTAASLDLTEPSEYASRLAVGRDRAGKLTERLTQEFLYRIERRGHSVVVEDGEMAEGVRFELTNASPRCRFSRPVP